MSASLPTAPAESKSPMFGTASLVLAACTVVVPIVIMVFFTTKANEQPDQQGWGWLAALAVLAVGAIVAVVAAGFTSLLGTTAGALALARGERGAWRSAVGLLINFPVLLLTAFLAIIVWANR